MTYDEVTEKVFKYSKGRINYEQKNLKQFRTELRPYLDTDVYPSQVGLIIRKYNQYWYCVIGRTAWGYDYYIPKTRTEEEKLKRETGYYDSIE